MERPTTFKGEEIPPKDHIANVEYLARDLARSAFQDAAYYEKFGTPAYKQQPIYSVQEGVISLPKFQITVTVAIHRPIVITEHVTHDYAPYEEDEG